MQHQVLIKEEDKGLRLYLDAIPLPGKWYEPKDKKYAIHDAKGLAKKNSPCEIIMVYSNGYRESIE